MDDLQDLAALVGRNLLGVLFVVSGVEKIGAFSDTTVYMASAGLPVVTVLLILAIIVEIGGGGAICLGWRTRPGAMVILLFTAAVTIVFHRFWDMPPDLVAVQRLMFMKNLSIMGGLIMLIAFGPGRIAFHYDPEKSG